MSTSFRFILRIHLAGTLGLIMFAACQTPYSSFVKSYQQFDQLEKKLADSLLSAALDHEALYTLCDTLKPMSSVHLFRLPLFSSRPTQRDSAQATMEQLQRVVNKLQFQDLAFVLNPFERRDSIYKNMEVYVFRKSLLQKRIQEQEKFYHSLGINQYSLPATVLAITEYEQKYIRWKSYGYLFGYPDYAVDFFVQAGKTQDSTGAFVKRDFFHVPVYAGKSGHFTYAMPKGHAPTQVDSVLYYKAQNTLARYAALRNKATVQPTKPLDIIKKLNR